VALTEETITRPLSVERSLAPAGLVWYGEQSSACWPWLVLGWVDQLRVRDVDEMVFIDPS